MMHIGALILVKILDLFLHFNYWSDLAGIVEAKNVHFFMPGYKSALFSQSLSIVLTYYVVILLSVRNQNTNTVL